MKPNLSAAAAGFLFGLGLVISGMTDPHKVRAFLDFAGNWDPSLACVMLGAIGVHLPLLRWMRRRARPQLAESYSQPPAKPIDRRLLFGAALFGIGWGTTGYCPAPAIASSLTSMPALVTLLSMGVGIALHEWWSSRNSQLSVPESPSFDSVAQP